ncbi:MAG: YbjN domain-containing protein [Chloroflexota bacterium]
MVPARPRAAGAPRAIAIAEAGVGAASIDAWLADLGLVAVDRGERDGISSWDLLLDGRRRHDIRTTLILDPSLALVCWVHYAPPINDSFRVSYRKLLRWNDELPFVKFAIAPDERPILTAELPVAHLELDALGVCLARVVTICDLLLDDSLAWLHPGAKRAPVPIRPSRHEALLERYADAVAELTVALGGDAGAPAPA